jgi:predicted aspartyl protease
MPIQNNSSLRRSRNTGLESYFLSFEKNHFAMTRIFAWSALAFLYLSFSACVSTGKLFRESSRSQEAFKTVISFEERSSLIIVPVEAGGKTRYFLLDTGAPNIITPELAKELKTKTLKNLDVRDINGRVNKQELVSVDSMRLGGVTFYQTAAIVADLNAQTELACLGIDGLIGANLLKGTILQIDYAKRSLALASSIDSLAVSPGAVKWPFTTTSQGTPKVAVRVNGLTFNALTVDTGSAGWIDLSEAAYSKVKEAGPVKSRTGFGVTSVGLYGQNEPHPIYRTWVEDVRISETSAPMPASIDFQGKGGRQTIGNAFWRQFVMTIDWKGNQLLLEPKEDYQIPGFKDFGFRTYYSEGQLRIGVVWKESEADRQGLKTGDRILFMNGMDCINFSEKQYCRYFLEKPLENAWEKVDLLIEQEGVTRRVELEKKKFF